MKITLYAVTAICALLSFEHVSVALPGGAPGEEKNKSEDSDGFEISFPQSVTASATETIIKYLQDFRIIGRELRTFSTYLASEPPAGFPGEFVCSSVFIDAFEEIRTGVNQLARLAGYIRNSEIPLAERNSQARPRFDVAYQLIKKGIDQIGAILLFRSNALVFKQGVSNAEQLIIALRGKLAMPVSAKMGISAGDTLWAAIEHGHLREALTASATNPVAESPEIEPFIVKPQAPAVIEGPSRQPPSLARTRTDPQSLPTGRLPSLARGALDAVQPVRSLDALAPQQGLARSPDVRGQVRSLEGAAEGNASKMRRVVSSRLPQGARPQPLGDVLVRTPPARSVTSVQSPDLIMDPRGRVRSRSDLPNRHPSVQGVFNQLDDAK